MNARGYRLIRVLFAAVLAILLTPAPGAAIAQEPAAAPVTYRASYQAQANGLNASARRSLTQLENGSYELANELEAKVLGQEIARLVQRSRFHYVDNAIVTDSYLYSVSGITSDLRSIEFDWVAGTALSIEDAESWTLEIQQGVFDPLSHQLALSQQLAAAPRIENYQTGFEFAVIDGDKVEGHAYQFIGEEVLQTPLGELNTIKFERVRSASSSRSTVIWLAPDWHYLVARIEQVNGSLQMRLELESAEVGGEIVTAMPSAD